MNREQNNRVRLFRNLLLWITVSIPALSFAEPDLRLSQSLRESLLAQGWQEYVAADGSTIFRQPSVTLETDNQSHSTELPAIRKFGGALQDRGWRVEWDPEGMLILKPAVAESPATQTAEDVSPLSSADVVPDMPGFKYWRIEKDRQGALLFHPLSRLPEEQPLPGTGQSLLGQCAGHQFQLDTVTIPVNEWSEAYELAQRWIDESAQGQLQVGRIRKIRRVYLVSLVGNREPYRLIHQLAIRESDGGVVLIY
ncbi:MAG: hypothetical protein KZQ93_13155 [Candidatus Thiodiazotropha sp. (ex Monitilora ramsayi)]|nr:hypothetical protein [Candidatus Thiodiazotropha sp. (ex Monitilora ramsayi)]